MKKILAFALLLIVGRSFAATPKLFQEESFNAAGLAEAVNHFVSIGESATIRELNELASDRSSDTGGRTAHRIGWVCRICYRPKGQELLLPPSFGLLHLGNVGLETTVGTVCQQWPLFPVALSGSTYFVLGDHYAGRGRGDDVRNYIAYCHTNGVFLTKPIPVPARAQALKDAAAIRHSKAWQSIKWKDAEKRESYGSEEVSWSYIQNQADSIPAE